MYLHLSCKQDFENEYFRGLLGITSDVIMVSRPGGITTKRNIASYSYEGLLELFG